jgi:hypothetical protein
MKARLPLLGFLLIFSCVPAAAQPTSIGGESRAQMVHPRLLLQSEDLKDRTWGAYLAGEYRVVEVLPALTAFLPLPPPYAGNEYECFCHALLDSLIRLKADLSVEMLTNIFERYPDEGVILFALASRQKRPALLDILPQPMPVVRWQAIGSLLAEARVPGFAALLMKQMQEINVSVTVSETVISSGEAGSGLSGSSHRLVPEGYPPTAFYHLTDESAAGAVLLTPRPHPIYYERRMVEPGQASDIESGGWTISSHYGDYRDPLRMEYLAMLLGQPVEDVRFDSKPLRALQWTGPETLEREIATICTKVLGDFDSLTARLSEKGLLSVSEAESIHARVHLKILDCRQDQSIALPELRMDRVIPEQE